MAFEGPQGQRVSFQKGGKKKTGASAAKAEAPAPQPTLPGNDVNTAVDTINSWITQAEVNTWVIDNHQQVVETWERNAGVPITDAQLKNMMYRTGDFVNLYHTLKTFFKWDQARVIFRDYMQRDPTKDELIHLTDPGTFLSAKEYLQWATDQQAVRALVKQYGITAPTEYREWEPGQGAEIVQEPWAEKMIAKYGGVQSLEAHFKNLHTYKSYAAQFGDTRTEHKLDKIYATPETYKVDMQYQEAIEDASQEELDMLSQMMKQEK